MSDDQSVFYDTLSPSDDEQFEDAYDYLERLRRNPNENPERLRELEKQLADEENAAARDLRLYAYKQADREVSRLTGALVRAKATADDRWKNYRMTLPSNNSTEYLRGGGKYRSLYDHLYKRLVPTEGGPSTKAGRILVALKLLVNKFDTSQQDPYSYFKLNREIFRDLSVDEDDLVLRWAPIVSQQFATVHGSADEWIERVLYELIANRLPSMALPLPLPLMPGVARNGNVQRNLDPYRDSPEYN